MNTQMNLVKCSRFSCKNKFLPWHAVVFNFYGETHSSCSYTCLHYVKKAVVCRVAEAHKQLLAKERKAWGG